MPHFQNHDYLRRLRAHERCHLGRTRVPGAARVGPITGSANQVIVRSSRLSLLNSPITRRVQYGCGPPQTLAVNPTTFTVRNKNSGPRASSVVV